ncbi:MAG: O-antigen ligase family protein [Bacteroidota bacterium]
MKDLSHVPGAAIRFGLYLFALTIPVSFVPAEFGVAIACAGWLMDGLVNKRWQIEWHIFFVPLTFYLVWNVISALVSPRPAHSLLAVGDNEWPALIMLLMFWTVRSEQVLKRIVFLFLGMSAITMAYAIWQTIFGFELYRSMPLISVGSLYRNVGFYSFYLTFAALAMTVFFLSGSLALQSTGRARTLLTFVAVLAFAAVVGSFARSIWLAMIFLTPLLGFAKGIRTGLITSAGLSAVVIILMITVPDLRERASSIIDPEQNQTRLNLWKTSMAIAEDYPLLGVGEDNFDFYFETYRVEGTYDTTTHPHNDYLNVLVASGVPGLLAFVLLWILALKTGFRTLLEAKSPFVRGTALGASLGLLGFLVGAFFQNYYGTFANCLGWWFMAGLIFASSQCSRQSLPESALKIES